MTQGLARRNKIVNDIKSREVEVITAKDKSEKVMKVIDEFKGKQVVYDNDD